MAPPGHSEGAFMGRRVDVQNASTRARGEYAQALAKIEEAGICPFCEEHLPKHHGKPILFSNAHWIVTENAWAYEGPRHEFVLAARASISKAPRCCHLRRGRRWGAPTVGSSAITSWRAPLSCCAREGRSSPAL